METMETARNLDQIIKQLPAEAKNEVEDFARFLLEKKRPQHCQVENRRTVKLLIDTNIILEVLLNQNRAQEARLLLARIDEYKMAISLFSLHTIGVLLIRQKKHQAYRNFLEEKK